MTYLVIPKEVIGLDCFRALQGADELGWMFYQIGRRYGSFAGSRTGRVVVPFADGVLIDVPANSQLVTGSNFPFLYYTQACRVISMRLFVRRNMGLRPMHDILGMMSVDWSTGTIDPLSMTAFYNPGSVTYAANPTMMTGGARSGPDIVAATPRYQVNGPIVQGGEEVGGAGASQHILSRCDRHHVVARPEDFIDESINLNLDLSDLKLDAAEILHNHF